MDQEPFPGNLLEVSDFGAIVRSTEKPTHTLQVTNVGVGFLGDAKPGRLGVRANWQQSEVEVSFIRETRLKTD